MGIEVDEEDDPAGSPALGVVNGMLAYPSGS